MEHFIAGIINKYGYIGIFILIAVENVFPPIPSEVILIFGGFVTTYSGLKVPGVIFAATFGSLAGAVILYCAGLEIVARKAAGTADRWGRILRLSGKDVRRAFDWFERYGTWAVFFCRLIPVLRSIVSVPAGMMGMNFMKFVMLTSAGALIWNSFLVSAGALLGASWRKALVYRDIYAKAVFACAVFVLLAWAARRFLRNRG